MVKRDPKTNQNNIRICPRCKGNGYIKIPHKSVEELNKSITVSCTMCDSQGEVEYEDHYLYVNADDSHKLQ